MDGPRLSKLQLSFEKMVEQIFTESKIDDCHLKEEIFASFTQILLKYSLPLKLNELDSRLGKGSERLYDVTDKESIREIFSSYLHEPVSDFLSVISEHEEKIKREIAGVKAAEAACDREIQEHTDKIREWMDRTLLSISEIKKQAQ
ncbi:hypothetical protein NEDG_01981 [Nematocida displodere]|uniref:Uncharacterized protein n=1 Tax=Nematocida displodere TaxID=1805483 RepID=A0A177EHH8_9MICR|nr:hypothetical protein NEDG_01981 [Nematocida displodere]